jgi:hypothetical protein
MVKTVFARVFLAFFLVLALLFLTSTSAQAIVDPLAAPNNKVGIHIISATPDEASAAADMVNSNGDWGYITILVESKDRNEGKWQEFFNYLRKRHLIPIVRLTTEPDPGGFWKRPPEKEEEAWADFLNKLIWPTKNRYVIIYNEPNHATEWGNTVDAKDYAKVLDKTITALKKRSPDFFVLNAGFDASAPEKLPAYQNQISFMKQMDEEIPGIFKRLDGWVSHSYPNPGFIGSPTDNKITSIRGWTHELEELKKLGVDKTLPVFIAETGWKHSDGIKTNNSLPSPEKIAGFYKEAFTNVWNNKQIVAVTPFLLNYQEAPFDHFSFQKITGNSSSKEYHKPYFTLKDLEKEEGKPLQENKAQLIEGEVYKSIVAGEVYNISLKVRNVGNSIWNDPAESDSQIQLVPIIGGHELGINPVKLPRGKAVEPGGEHDFFISLKSPDSGMFKVSFNLYAEERQFESPAFDFSTQVKDPVVLKVNSKLKWKSDYEGNYLLSIAGTVGQRILGIMIDPQGNSDEFEARYLLPDYTFDFTLEKPFYKPKTIRKTVQSGVNELDFGELQPDISSAILRPEQLWKLLPFSN